MSWAPALTTSQQQQQQQHPHPAPVHPPPVSFVNQSGTASMSNSMWPQNHASVASPFPTSQTAQPHQQQQQQQQPQQHPQSHFTNQQQSQAWQQQQNYLQQNKIMQPTAANNWQQQQNVANANVYLQQQQQPAAPATYNNYYAQAPPTQPQQHQQPQQQHYQQPDAATFYQQQPPPQQQQQQQPLQNAGPQEYFENSNNKADGWGDWDWNDNTNNAANNTANNDQHHSLQSQNQQPPQQQHQPPPNYNPNIIEDSFNTQSTDNWHWGASDDTNANTSVEQQRSAIAPIVDKLPPAVVSFPPPTITPHVPNAALAANEQQPVNSNFQVPLPQKVGDFSVATSKQALVVDHLQFQANAVKPTSLLLPEATNDNYNNVTAAGGAVVPPPAVNAASAGTNNNIPSSVYVSQAKPVSRPPRQYASPPGGSTPADTPERTLIPPQAFQNESATHVEAVAAVTAPPPPPTMQQPPPPAMTPPAALPPPPAIGNAGAGNPFKRAGAVQHHRAGLMPTTATTPVQMAPLAPPSGGVSSAFNVPPPPADFANPAMEPDNSEVLHENQEVIAPPAPLPLLSVATPVITMPGGVSGQALPAVQPAQPTPPNDERNQYLQTSHLSENPDEELNLEGDSLPPPGLSRLVLGQPELEAASQRMVTGTEEPNNSISANIRNIEERHADGEDNSMEQPLANAIMMNPTMRGAMLNSGIAGVPSTSATNLDINSDRNLYLVPGESNASNEQRVVTGVETVEDTIVANPTQVISEQREIELDGENLEDEPQQPPIAAVSSRNEPPLEGAASVAEAPLPVVSAELVETHYTNSQLKSDLSNVSTGNDESDHARYGNKTRNPRSQSNEGNKKLDKQHKDKQRSVERYDSDESEEEYSSDRERDRRRGYREGSVRSERERDERELKEKRRRSKRESGGGGDRDKTRDKHYYRDGEVAKSERLVPRNTRYGYGTEESSRHEPSRKDPSRRSTRGAGAPAANDRGGRSDRSDRDYDDYQRRGYRGSKRGDKSHVDDRDERRGGYAVDEDRRDRRHRYDRGERADYDTIERRRRGEKQRAVDPREYEEYRKRSSRNARESDVEKERGGGGGGRAERNGYDPRHVAMYGYPTAAYGYDPYYYYEQMARTNPQAYSEWYKKYYGHAAATSAAAAGGGPQSLSGMPDHLTGGSSVAATDGRESVHSGRSSVHNEKDRYTYAYISQANEYHRHFQHHQQQQQQQQMAINNISLNSTMLEDATGSHYGGLNAARSISNLSQIHATAVGGGAYYAGPERSYYARSEYAESRSGNLSLRDAEPISTDPQRLTPCKFINEHAVVSLSAGILVTVKPKYTPHGCISNIVKLQHLGGNDSTRQLYHSFPGPLVRGLTHKKTIIEFCEEQIRLGPMQTTIYAKQLLPNSVEKYRSSYTLMWNLLILLLRQNGMVVGTDIAELLLKNQQNFPYKSHTQSPNSTAANSLQTRSQSDNESPEDSIADEKLSDGEAEDPERETTTENNLVTSTKSDGGDSLTSAAKSSSLSEVEITEKFRNYLIYGNVNEALDWATDNNLWGHALFLASKVDRRSHANVMMKFANKLSLNDPLQTLYQLMSGRTPSSVTSVQDEKWGDWRPHLSMILSNTSQKPELDRKAITTLGDSLFNRGDLFAAHFCYLMAQVGFGRYQESASLESTLQQNLPKLILLGSSHYKTFREFASNESIIMTEIYEYACSLNDDKFSLVEFQPYKYLLATRMLDYGYHLKSLMYMEQIALHIQREPSKYEATFINKIYEFGDRLKYYDPVLEKSMDDQNMDGNLNGSLNNFEEQKWLQDLRAIVAQQKVVYNEPSSTAAPDTQENNYQLQNQIDQQFAEINKQFNELNMQYSNNNAEATTFYNPETMQQQQPAPPQIPTIDNQQTQQQPPITEYAAQNQPQYVPTPSEAQPPPAIDAVDPYANYGQQYMQPDQQQPQQQQQQQNSYYDPSQHQQQYNSAEVADAQNAGGNYEYWAAQQQQQQHAADENARPTISMPKSKTYESDDERNQQQKGGNQQKGNKNDAKDLNKSLQQSNQNSGWFGGIWNKLSMKPKNQMILPDDKNPTIVWDSEKKRWVNTTNDGDEAVEDSLKPPPKMSDLMPPQQQQQQQYAQPPPQQQQQLHQQQPPFHPQQQQQPQAPLMDPQYQYGSMPISSTPTTMPTPTAAAGAPSALGGAVQNYSAAGVAVMPATTNDTAAAAAAPKAPSLQSNMFKMQRNRTLKNSYVDVFNPSGAPMSKASESVLAPALPPAAVPQGGFFIPGAAPAVNNDAGAYQQQQQHQQVPQQDVPQFYNPNQYGAGGVGGY